MFTDPAEYSLRQDLDYHLAASVAPSESSPAVAYVRACDFYNIHADALIFFAWRLRRTAKDNFMDDITSAANEYIAALRYGDEESEFHSEMTIYKTVASQHLMNHDFLAFNSLFLRYKETAKALIQAEKTAKETHGKKLTDA